MSLFVDALGWIAAPESWSGQDGVPVRLAQHLAITLAAVAIAAAVALPVGVSVGHWRRGRAVVVGLSGAFRALPTLGLLTLVGLAVGIGLRAPLVALVVLAVPSLLAGAYAGVESVSATTVDAARAVGLTEWQLVRRVELPLGLPILIGGIRAAVLQVVATATLAAYIADAGLGRYLFEGLKTRDYAQMLGGSILVAVLALLLDAGLGAAQRWSVPAGVSGGAAVRRTPRSNPAASDGRPTTKGST